MFLRFNWGNHVLLEELGRHADIWGRSRECPKCEACKELVEHVFLVYIMIPREFFGTM